MKSFKHANRRTFMAAGSIALMSGLAGFPGLASARTLADIVASKKLVVGVNPTLPPLGIFNDKNEIDGFDADVTRKLGELLGVKTEIVQVGSPDRIPFVVSGKIDAVLGAMTITAERQKVIDFTVPLHTEILGVLTTKSKTYKEMMDLNDAAVRLVQVRGSTPVKLAQEKLPKAQLLLLDNYPDAVRAIAQGRADAFLYDQLSIFKYCEANAATTRAILKPFVEESWAIGIRKGNDTLRSEVNAFLEAFRQSGAFSRLGDRYLSAEKKMLESMSQPFILR